MKRMRWVAAALALLAGGLGPARGAAGQERCKVLCQPVLVLQPGLVITNVFDPPAGADAEADFHARFLTAVPTGIPRTTLVAIVQWTPFNEVNDFTRNAPSLVVGPVVNVVSTRPFSLDLDVLDSYSPAAEEDDESAYTHKLVLEADAFLHVGRLLVRRGGWQNLSLYGFLAYVATGLPEEADPWVILTGVSLPIAPWPFSREARP